MKNIKIVTFHRAHNYGALLQAYALQNYFLEHNYNTQIIDYRCKMIEEPYNINYHKNMNFKSLLKLMIKKIFFNNKIKKRFTNFNNFIEKKLFMTKSFNNYIDIENSLKNNDILITGSDQVWSHSLVGCLDDVYTLNFKSKNLKISYAASIGNIENIDKFKDEFVEKIDKLDRISVREKAAKDELEKIIDKDIEVTLDPTLLIESSFWNNLVKTNIQTNKYIFCYMVQKDSEFIKIANYISKVTGLKIIHSNLTNPGFINVYKSIYELDPIDFINYINNAEYVITTSFHATVFSIIFHKKFYVVPHKKTGTRVTNLLEKLNIKDRNFDSLEEFKYVENIDSSINWKNVDNLLKKERNKSQNWILNAVRMRDKNE